MVWSGKDFISGEHQGTHLGGIYLGVFTLRFSPWGAENSVYFGDSQLSP